jgi:hypothetical protein
MRPQQARCRCAAEAARPSPPLPLASACTPAAARTLQAAAAAAAPAPALLSCDPASPPKPLGYPPPRPPPPPPPPGVQQRPAGGPARIPARPATHNRPPHAKRPPAARALQLGLNRSRIVPWTRLASEASRGSESRRPRRLWKQGTCGTSAGGRLVVGCSLLSRGARDLRRRPGPAAPPGRHPEPVISAGCHLIAPALQPTLPLPPRQARTAPPTRA